MGAYANLRLASENGTYLDALYTGFFDALGFALLDQSIARYQQLICRRIKNVLCRGSAEDPF
jgi:hypothetical protein